jgi:hypothetical protein
MICPCDFTRQIIIRPCLHGKTSDNVTGQVDTALVYLLIYAMIDLIPGVWIV